MIKTILATFVIAAVLRPFRGQRRLAVHAEKARAAGLRSTLCQMFLDRWDKVFGKRFTTKQVGPVTKTFALRIMRCDTDVDLVQNFHFVQVITLSELLTHVRWYSAICCSLL